MHICANMSKLMILRRLARRLGNHNTGLVILKFEKFMIKKKMKIFSKSIYLQSDPLATLSNSSILMKKIKN